jgi:hypothetical protein
VIAGCRPRCQQPSSDLYALSVLLFCLQGPLRLSFYFERWLASLPIIGNNNFNEEGVVCQCGATAVPAALRPRPRSVRARSRAVRAEPRHQMKEEPSPPSGKSRRKHLAMEALSPNGPTDPEEVYLQQERQMREREEGAQQLALELLNACRCGNVLEALRLMGCTHCKMLLSRIVAAVEEGPQSFLASQPVEKAVKTRAALGADDAVIPELALDIAASMCAAASALPAPCLLCSRAADSLQAVRARRRRRPRLLVVCEHNAHDDRRRF